ncbi:MAG TPA: lytic transglycosylase domain-containing protein, partial [Minicystis sp.]|nr:lytic transglycosylase domain-containing protein [Minicystis sp.]
MRILRAAGPVLALLLGLAAPARADDTPAKPKPKPAATSKKSHAKPKHRAAPKRARKPGEAGEPDDATRRIIAGTASPTGKSTLESPELKAMRELDLTLFPSPAGSAGAPFYAEGSPVVDLAPGPRLAASGLPPDRALENLPRPEAPLDLTWLKKLEMPDIPVRWDARVVRYLEYYKNNPRGRAMVREFVKKSGRYGAAIRKTLREQGLPEDILWLALVESGFDASIQSPAGAAGLWQFMPDGAKIYGLTVDRWIDERLDPERSTVAAARYLADLKQRFGNW